MSTELLAASEVAELFGVCRRTVLRWARTGRLHTIRAPGGPYRFFADEVLALLDEGAEPLDVEAVVVPFERRFVRGGSSRTASSR